MTLQHHFRLYVAQKIAQKYTRDFPFLENHTSLLSTDLVPQVGNQDIISPCVARFDCICWPVFNLRAPVSLNTHLQQILRISHVISLTIILTKNRTVDQQVTVIRKSRFRNVNSILFYDRETFRDIFSCSFSVLTDSHLFGYYRRRLLRQVFAELSSLYGLFIFINCGTVWFNL